MLEVQFFNNGNTAVFKDGEQVTGLQSPWILEYAKILDAQEIDLTEVSFGLPAGGHARFFRTDDNQWNWTITP